MVSGRLTTNIMTHKTLHGFILVLGLCAVTAALAQKVYRWVDESGQVHFSQTPPPEQDPEDAEVMDYGAGGQADADCCREVYRFSLEVVRHMRRGLSSLEIYEIFPPQSYPHVVEVSNFAAARVDSDLSASAIAGLTRDACMNRTFQACRVETARSSRGRDGGSGSGVAVAGRLVLTNHHVVADCDRITVGRQRRVARRTAVDAEADLAVLRVDSALEAAVTVSSRSRAALGETVVAAGFPLGDLLGSLNVTTGTVSSDSGIGGDDRVFQLTAPVQPGSSGGPVLDEFGHLVGIVVARLDDARTMRSTGMVAQNVNFAIRLATIKAFLDRHRVNYRTASGEARTETREVAEQARAYTRRVFCD